MVKSMKYDFSIESQVIEILEYLKSNCKNFNIALFDVLISQTRLKHNCNFILYYTDPSLFVLHSIPYQDFILFQKVSMTHFHNLSNPTRKRPLSEPNAIFFCSE